jgi:hypothetical protein
VEELTALLTLQTAVAKSRAFVRVALNCGAAFLEELLATLLQSERVLQCFFTDGALLRNPQEASVLVRVCVCCTHSLAYSLVDYHLLPHLLTHLLTR